MLVMTKLGFYRDLATASVEDLRETLDDTGSSPHMTMNPAVVLEELSRRESARQTNEIVRLTRHVRNLTWVLVAVGAVSLVAAGIAAYAAIVLLARG